MVKKHRSEPCCYIYSPVSFYKKALLHLSVLYILWNYRNLPDLLRHAIPQGRGHKRAKSHSGHCYFYLFAGWYLQKA